jgi:GT2 family glycosyltransferase
MISAIIPIINEDPNLLIEVLHNITSGCHPSDLEVILYNDGSVNHDGSFASLHNLKFPIRIKKYLKIIDSTQNSGVGYAFDRGVEVAEGDIVVLMGADVFPQEGWFYDVKYATEDDELGCSCSVGLQPDNYDINKPGMQSRYGATISWTMTTDDLPKSSPMKNDPDYREIIGCRWAGKKSNEPYEIDAVYGAFYFCKREFYQKIHGFDTIVGKHLHGHAFWGHLEAMLSLKVRVYGGKCMMYPNIRAGHVFGRLNIDNFDSHRAVRMDYHYWNRLWIAHTMLDDELRDECLNHLIHCLNLSQAQVWIKQNWSAVRAIRERNEREGKLISK